LPQLARRRQWDQRFTQCQLPQMLIEGALGAHCAASSAVLATLWPFCAARKPLRKLVVACLRRAQAVQHVPARVAATRGFLLLIVHSLHGGAEEMDVDGQIQKLGPSCALSHALQW
jgi:hypothetical protein